MTYYERALSYAREHKGEFGLLQSLVQAFPLLTWQTAGEIIEEA